MDLNFLEEVSVVVTMPYARTECFYQRLRALARPAHGTHRCGNSAASASGGFLIHFGDDRRASVMHTCSLTNLLGGLDLERDESGQGRRANQPQGRGVGQEKAALRCGKIAAKPPRGARAS